MYLYVCVCVYLPHIRISEIPQMTISVKYGKWLRRRWIIGASLEKLHGNMFEKYTHTRTYIVIMHICISVNITKLFHINTCVYVLYVCMYVCVCLSLCYSICVSSIESRPQCEPSSRMQISDKSTKAKFNWICSNMHIKYICTCVLHIYIHMNIYMCIKMIVREFITHTLIYTHIWE